MGPRTRGEDEAVEEVITEGPASEKVTGEDGFFFAFAAEHFQTYTHTHTYQSFLPVCGYFQSLPLLPLGARCPPPLFTRSSLLYSFSPVLPLHSVPSSAEL